MFKEHPPCPGLILGAKHPSPGVHLLCGMIRNKGKYRRAHGGSAKEREMKRDGVRRWGVWFKLVREGYLQEMSIEKRSERSKGALQTSGKKGIWAEGIVKAEAGGDERVQPWAFIIAGVRCSQERAHQEGPNLTQVHWFPLSACGGC